VLSPTRVLIAAGTGNGVTQGEAQDDVVHLLAPNGNPKRATLPVPNARSVIGPPVPIGNHRVIQLENHVENTPLRHLQIIDGVPGGIVLDRISLAAVGSEVELRARFALPEPEVFGIADLILRVGAVQQRIPAATIAKTRRGFRYRDESGANGFFRLVEYDVRRKRLRAIGRSVLPIASLGANRVVSLESSEFYIASSPPPEAE
jgi:hypothetical protein